MSQHLNLRFRRADVVRPIITLALACAGAFTGSAGGVISFSVASPASQNFMYPGDYAGASGARVNNWNNLVADANGSADDISLSAGSVRDASGNVLGGMRVVLHPSSAGGGVVNYGNRGGTNDPKMFLDYDDCLGGNSFANYGYLDVMNIPYARYSIYCYAASDNSPSGSLANARGGFWLITNAPGGPVRCYIKDVDNSGTLVPEPDTSGNGYVASQTTSIPSGSSSWTNVNGGNYVVFNTLLTNSATRVWFGAMGGNGGGMDDLGNTFTDGDTGALRLKVCGFQIVRSLIGLTATNLYLQSPVPDLSPDRNYALIVLADFTDGTVGGNVTTLPETIYASSDTNIFSVSTNGVLTAGMRNGVASLTVMCQANTLQVLVTNPVAISMVQDMPSIPSPFLMRDWKQVASNYDSFVFNHNLSGTYLPLIVPENANENFNLPWFALPSYVGFTNYSQPEGINAIAAVLGASLVGIDKSNQNGTNWVLMMSQYCDTAVNVFFNNAFYATSARMDFWYCLLPHILFVGLVDHYPATANEAIPLSHGGGTQTMNGLFYAAATNWYDACLQLGAGPSSAPDFNYLGCTWPGGQPYPGGWVEPEGAAGVAWLEYMAWRDFGNTNFLQAADWGLEFMQNSTGNIVYETLLPYGVLAAARMNAEEGRNYDINKFMNWCFDGNGYSRPAWGVMTGQWGGSDVDGLIGSQNDGGGYAFAMNTFEWAGALAPVARYDQRYAHDLGKWLLNLANNARLFYSTYVPADHQSSGWWLNGTNDIISYEGLRASWNGTNLYACGDATGNGDPTDFALYGASHVGLLAAIVGSTSDPMIPQLDLRATDHFLDASYPTYLYYNPHATNATFTVNYGAGTNDLLDIVNEQFLATGATGSVALTLPPDTAAVIVVLPAGVAIGTQGTRMCANGYIVDYRYSGIDTDGDGLPDWWETLYFGNSTNANPNAIAASGYTYLTCYQLGISPFATNLFNQEIISFNVCSLQNSSQDFLDAGDYAGAPGVRTNHWNNLVASNNWSSGNITLSSGTVSNSAGNLVSGLSVTFHPAGNGGGVGTYSGGGNTNDTKMIVDYNDAWSCAGFSQYGYLDITGIPFARYQIYCYAATDNSPNGSPTDARGGFFVITNAPGGTNRCYLKDVDSRGNIVPEPNSSGSGYVESTTTSIRPGGTSFTNVDGGNYVVFNSILTNSSTRVWFGALGDGQGVDDLGNTITDGNSAVRLKVCGFQIVESATALTPTRMNASVLSGMLKLSWPSDHLGWRLEMNAVGLTVTNAWFPYPGSDTVTSLFVPIGASGNVFFRLTYP